MSLHISKETYDRSVATGEVQLIGYWQKMVHYTLVGFFLFMPVVVLSFRLIEIIQGKPGLFQEGELGLLIIPSILAGVVYWIQKQQLKFRVVKTNLNRVQLKEILINVAAKMNWEFVFNSDEAYVAKTSPGFLSGSWGEQITILFHEDSVFVNSICDPDKRPAMVSFGRNNDNEEALIDKINEENIGIEYLP